MRKDKDLAQIGIIVKPELREWLTQKCQQARTNEGRIVSISLVLGAYIEKLKELDALDPYDLCPFLQKEKSDTASETDVKTSSAVDWSEIVNPIREQIKALEAKFNETYDYEQKLAALEEKFTNTIDEKISELFTRLQSQELLNPIAITSNSAGEIEAAIAPILRRLEQLESDYQQSTSNLQSNLESNPDSDLKDDSHNEAVASQEKDELPGQEDNEAAETQVDDVAKTETMTKAEMARILKVSASTVSNWVRNGKWSKFPTDWKWHPIREHFERTVTFAAPDNSP